MQRWVCCPVDCGGIGIAVSFHWLLLCHATEQFDKWPIAVALLASIKLRWIWLYVLMNVYLYMMLTQTCPRKIIWLQRFKWEVTIYQLCSFKIRDWTYKSNVRRTEEYNHWWFQVNMFLLKIQLQCRLLCFSVYITQESVKLLALCDMQILVKLKGWTSNTYHIKQPRNDIE